MSTTMTAPMMAEEEQRLVLQKVNWNQYVTISDALGERHGLRIIYLDGRLTFLTTSRRHDWHSARFDDLIKAIVSAFGITWEDAGSATLRLEQKTAGVEGDKTYYFGEHAEMMKGPIDIDLTTQPPPDLAVEVEVSHPADHSMGVYGRLGVPEVWRFDAERFALTFWRRRDDGTYEPIPRSGYLPMLDPADVAGQLRLADELGAARWYDRLAAWVRDVLVPRLERDNPT